MTHPGVSAKAAKPLPPGRKDRRVPGRVLYARKQGLFPNVSARFFDAPGSVCHGDLVLSLFTRAGQPPVQVSFVPRRLARPTAKTIYRLIDGGKDAP